MNSNNNNEICSIIENNSMENFKSSNTNELHNKNINDDISAKTQQQPPSQELRENSLINNQAKFQINNEINAQLPIEAHTEVRKKFRKSHTCGSLFAKCNCTTLSESLSVGALNNPKALQSLIQLQTTLRSQSNNALQSDTLIQTELNSKNFLSPQQFITSPADDLSQQNTSTIRNGHRKINAKLKNENDTNKQKRLMKQQSLAENEKLQNDTTLQSNIDENSNDSTIDNLKNYSKKNYQKFKQSTTSSCGDNLIRSNLSRPNLKKLSNKKLFQSYSHPDTDFIFTDSNRNPNRSRNSVISGEILSKSGERFEIKHPKRSSSPNIGNCKILNVHPELLVKIHNKSEYAENTLNNCENNSKLSDSNESIDKRSSFKQTKSSDSDASIEIVIEHRDSNEIIFEKRQITSEIIPINETNEKDKNQLLKEISVITTSPPKVHIDSAQKFFEESGILGPIIKTNTVNLIRKTSKILQDTNTTEQIRKNSKILLRSSSNLSPSNSAWATMATVETDAPMECQQNLKSHSIANFTKANESFKCNCQDDIKELTNEIASLKDMIKNRDSEIHKLKREIHKLKSVLQQTTSGQFLTKQKVIITNNGEYKYSALVGQNPNLNEMVENNKLIAKKVSTNIIQSNVPMDNVLPCSSKLSQSQMGPPNQVQQPQQQPQHLAVKKQGVSGESCDASNQHLQHIPIPKYDKDFRSKQLIKDAIMDNDFLKNIDSSQVRELVESMYSLNLARGESVIREGEVGAHLYVSAQGEFEVIKNDTVLGVMGPGKAFGELAILYNCTRTASVRVLCDSKVWVLDRRVFQQIMMRTGMQRIEDNVRFLKSVPLLKSLSDDVLAKISDVLEVEFYPAGTYIIRQGASGDTFFLISQGTVKVTQKLGNQLDEKEIRTLERGDYFGEQALINEDKRTANIIAMAPGVECLTLDRQSFSQLIGDLCELKEKCYGDENRIMELNNYERSEDTFGKNLQQEYPELTLDNLEAVSTLGVGGFGRVELVKCYMDNHVQTFALKCLKKTHIVETRQEEHVFSERTIMLTCQTPFICRLHRTFRDTKYVYMLLEACMGGEVWTILRDRGCFDEQTAQFIIGCVLQAFEYLHSRGIIYRDLKPENLMLDERGYVKLVDFGFAKHIGLSQKTWTFCGTPEYVAPEIILNKGHDRAVDYWALGILIHELLNGTPPFTANDPMKTYNIILKGIDMIDFPKHMSRSAIMLIKKLCRDVPSERLGYQKGGIQDIKKHKWFQGFDWDGLSNLTLVPPFMRPITHPLDTCYFDKFSFEADIPPDEVSGWDLDF